jgi:hypothetical protein
MTGRDVTAGNPEDEYYPGTSVLINLEDIRDPEELLKRETELQLAVYEPIFSPFDEGLTPDLPFFYYLYYSVFSPPASLKAQVGSNELSAPTPRIAVGYDLLNLSKIFVSIISFVSFISLMLSFSLD